MSEASDNKSKSAENVVDKGTALVDCLVRLAKAHRLSASPQSLTVGLPATIDTFTPDLLVRASARVGLNARLQLMALDELSNAILPAIIIDPSDQCYVLLAIENDAAQIYDPIENAERVEPLDSWDIGSAMTVLVARPKFRLDAHISGQLGMTPDHWFWSAMREHSTLYRDVLLASFFINLLVLSLPIFVMNVYDRVVPNAAFETLWVLSVGVALALLGDWTLRVLRAHFLDFAARRIDVSLSAQIMEKTLGMRMEFKPPSVGGFAANLRSFEFLRDFTTSATVTSLIDIPFALVFVIVIAWISPTMVIPILVGIGAVLIFTTVIRPSLQRLTERSYSAGAQRNATVIEAISSLETIKAMGAESIMQRRWEETSSFLAAQNLQVRGMNVRLSQTNSTFQQFSRLAVVITGVYLIAAGQLTMGGLIACMLLSTRAVAPFAQFGALMGQFHHAKIALKTLDELFETPTDYRDDSAFISRDRFNGQLDFKDVTFDYPRATSPSLHGVSFSLKSGDRMAILGRVGSGKSTIAKLALGLFEPRLGEIRVDGVDLRQIDPREYRGSIGYVPQEVTLFQGTLRENIELARPNISDAQLIKAVERASLSDWINRHPMGFEMPIAERGDSVSGGQKRCIAVARALVTEPNILIMDEPTGGTDLTTERLIIDQLSDYLENRTLLLVTHRNSLLTLANRILVVDAGQVVADGDRDTVVAALREGKVGRADA